MMYNQIAHSHIKKSYWENNFIKKAARCQDWAGWERLVKKHLEASGFKVIRTDYKNGMPDFLAVLSHNSAVFVECKFYSQSLNSAGFWKDWHDKDPEQMKNFLKLSERINVIMVVNSKEGPIIMEINDLEHTYGKNIKR